MNRNDLDFKADCIPGAFQTNRVTVAADSLAWANPMSAGNWPSSASISVILFLCEPAMEWGDPGRSVAKSVDEMLHLLNSPPRRC